MLTFWRAGARLDGPEAWYPCFGFEVDYLISTHGRIMRMSGGKGAKVGRILKRKANQDGYLTVNLSGSGKRRTFNVHFLVARTFLGKPQEDEFGKFEIHHGPDNNTTNCRAANLSYVTRKANMEEQWQRRYQTRGQS